MKTFVITLSKRFPGYHKRKGQETNFKHKYQHQLKNHTIRANYKLWKRRIDKINSGEAILSIREWSGKPYFSKQVEIAKLTKVGIQKCDVEIYNGVVFISVEDKLKYHEQIKDIIYTNGGLSPYDFISWFKNPVIEGAIIHFTDIIRY